MDAVDAVDAVEAVLEQRSREHPDIDVSPIGIVGRVMRLSRLWDKEIKDFPGEHSLEPGKFDVLSTLRRSGEPYELTAKAFLKASLVTTGAITLRVDRMAAKGLVTTRVRSRGQRPDLGDRGQGPGARKALRRTYTIRCTGRRAEAPRPADSTTGPASHMRKSGLATR
ncbi:MarR family transcriptional regulator [Nonomuraea diastatica]|uniref:MarR family transcriptional regulator n=1 Tax=Nonomuraea diastatica TaxID=1848329 RepID=UPI001C704BBE|nr:helix-turn-helix domain-containing protein [Nonomuraea diastatica]